MCKGTTTTMTSCTGLRDKDGSEVIEIDGGKSHQEGAQASSVTGTSGAATVSSDVGHVEATHGWRTPTRFKPAACYVCGAERGLHLCRHCSSTVCRGHVTDDGWCPTCNAARHVKARALLARDERARRIEAEAQVARALGHATQGFISGLHAAAKRVRGHADRLAPSSLTGDVLRAVAADLDAQAAHIAGEVRRA